MPCDAERAMRDLLWIDDAIAKNDPQLHLLCLQGYCVDYATCGLDGLRLVERRQYRSVFLDLRLPDISGLEVLARLRAGGYTEPILVLTGFADIESAFSAGQLGATQFKSKPLLDDIDQVLANLLRAHDAIDGAPARTETVGHKASRLVGLGTLLSSLDRLSGDSRDGSAARGAQEGATVVAALMRGLSQPDLSVPIFLALARVLRLALTRHMQMPASALAAFVRDEVVREAAIVRAHSTHDSRVTEALSLVESQINAHHRSNEHDLAGALNISAGHLGRRIHAVTGLTFREWRSGFAMKAALQLLLATREQTKQIGRVYLDFGHESQFNREFRSLFGVPPGKFRHLWRTHVTARD